MPPIISIVNAYNQTSNVLICGQKSIYFKIYVAYNNVFRKLLKLPPRSSASLMFASLNVFNFETLIRTKEFSFVEGFEKESQHYHVNFKLKFN